MSHITSPLRIGALLFDGFELLDVFGPLEMFGLLGTRAKISMLAEKTGVVASSSGPQCVADSTLKEATMQDLDVLLIPGGIGTRHEINNVALLEQLHKACANARFVASVCTGSALLAKTGILDGKRATTNKRAYHWVVAQSTMVNWVPEARWVVDGKFFTSSGVSAGMDMALALIGRLCGKETAHVVAQQAEYEWHYDPAWDPFAKINGLA